MSRQIFTTTQVGKICCVSGRTVSKWVDTGHLAGYRLPNGRDRRITREALEKFLREHGMETLLAAIPEPAKEEA